MFISKKIAEYFKQNKDKPKSEIINGLVEMGYKESTAKAYYANRNTIKYAVNWRKKTFEFFEANPLVLNDFDNGKYAKQLGMPKSTYSSYKYMYLDIQQRKETLRIKLDKEEAKEVNKVPLYGEKYFKGRERQKFKIDDSNL